MIFILLFFCSTAFATVPEDQAIRAIIGEAENQGITGMTAVAEAIRNRGTLKGVYGLHSKRVDFAPQYLWDQARMAWELSATTNLVKGADHWENIRAFGVPSWAKNMKKTVTIKDHAFYKGGSR